MLSAFAGALGTAGYYLYPKFKGKIQEVRNTDDGASKSGAGFASINDPNKSAPIAPGQQQFPRRILGICVNNYLFANPISYGYDPRGTVKRDFNSLLTRLGDKLKIPRSQMYE